MPCETHALGDGSTVITCTRGARRTEPCDFCPEQSVALCDSLLEAVAFGAKPRTCDKRMCRHHRTSVGRNVDHCPDHVGVAAAR